MKEKLKDLHLVVLMGGPGSEREVSLRSARPWPTRCVREVIA
jgi:hypothetical protein